MDLNEVKQSLEGKSEKVTEEEEVKGEEGNAPPGLEECKVEDNVTIIIETKGMKKGKRVMEKRIKRVNASSGWQLSHVWLENPQLRTKTSNFIAGSSVARLNPDLDKEIQNKITERLKQNSPPDKQIYDELWELIHNYKKTQTQPNLITHAFDHDTWQHRSSSRVKQLINLLPRGFAPTSLLDIGCSEGSITASVGKYYNLPPNQVHGCDVHQSSTSNPDYTFNLINESDCKLPYANESMSVIIAFVSLHHVKELNKMLTEIKRVLKPQGFFVVREHDCDNNDEFAAFLDVVHGMYATVLSEPREMTGQEFKECFYAQYRTKKQWCDLITADRTLRLFSSDKAKGIQKVYGMSFVKQHSVPPKARKL